VVNSTAAQVCSCIAQIELPKNMWPTLVDVLLQNTTSEDSNLKKGTLQAIGYTCEEIVCVTLYDVAQIYYCANRTHKS
jgi:hypothetical protein